jgi:hypothetical protein
VLQFRQTLGSNGFAMMSGSAESLPLAADDYGVLINHLSNAQAYFNQGEVGAGLFEMRFVNAMLSRH